MFCDEHGGRTGGTASSNDDGDLSGVRGMYACSGSGGGRESTRKQLDAASTSCGIEKALVQIATRSLLEE